MNKLKDIKKDKIFVAVSGAVLLIAITVILIFTLNRPDVVTGSANERNSAQANDGFAIEYNDRIIVSLYSVSDSNNFNADEFDIDLGVISIDKDGQDPQLISKEMAKNLNFDGTWIYYINNNDGGSIYRMKPDGSEKSKLYGDTAFGLIYDDDGYLYFSDSKSNSVKRIDKEGKNESTLIENCATSGLTIVGDRVYFFGTSGYNERYLMSVLKTGGGVKKHFKDTTSYHLIGYGDSLYYINGENSMIHRLKIGKKQPEKVSDKVVYKYYIRDNAFYALWSDSSQEIKISKIPMDGGEEEFIYKGIPRTINMAYDLILCSDRGSEYKRDLYVVKNKTGERVARYQAIDVNERNRQYFNNLNGEN